MELTNAELEGAIVSLVERKYSRLKLSDEDISEMLFGNPYSRRQVNEACRRLIADDRLIRGGGGVAYDPFWYRPWHPPFERRI
ncbi:MAG: hypothetical protein ACR65U_05855 [Methylocystis sp.]|jgi:hypothetical protein